MKMRKKNCYDGIEPGFAERASHILLISLTGTESFEFEVVREEL